MPWMADPRNPSMAGHSGRQFPFLWVGFPTRNMASISFWFASIDEDVVSQQPQSCQQRRVLLRWRGQHMA